MSKITGSSPNPIPKELDTLPLHDAHLADLQAGLREAERGEFASEAEIATTIFRFTKNQRRR